VAVFIAGLDGYLFASLARVANQDWSPGVRMKLRSVYVMMNKPGDVSLDLCVTLARCAVYADETRAREDANVAEDAIVLGFLRKRIEPTTNRVWRHRLRKTEERGYTRVSRVALRCGACFFHGFLHAARADRNLHAAQTRAGDGQHQCRGV